MNLAMATPTQVLTTAASAALLAPSVHNTQPWRFVLDADALEIHADRSRQLEVSDPFGRQLMISCGCALFNARVALAAQGYDAIVHRIPDPARKDLIATITLPSEQTEWNPIASLEQHIARRHSNRRRFQETSVSPSVLYDLTSAAGQEHAELFRVREEAHRRSLSTLSQQAEALEAADSRYQQELWEWTTVDAKREDGVPAMAVPYASSETAGDLPIRDYDTRAIGWLPAESRSGSDECLLMLTTDGDDELSWLRAGEALQRVWLEATKANYVISLFTQVIEVPNLRNQLRAALTPRRHPQLVLRIGRAAATPASGRRSLDDVLS